MSPRRRLLVTAALALALVAAVGVVLARRSPAITTSTGTPVAATRPGPVLLVPGYGGGTDSLRVLAGVLQAAGRRTVVVPLPGDGTGDLRLAADALQAAVLAERARGAASVDLVGFSAGGVIVRTWVREHGGARVARRIVTLGSPNQGSTVAGFAASAAPESCPTACRQLVPGSPLLRELNDGDETPAGPGWVSVWTEQDQVVTPPDSARLAGALNVPLQRVCRDSVVEHGQLPRDPLVAGVVLRALDELPLPKALGPADCTALRQVGGG